jgi:hypothetical protein
MRSSKRYETKIIQWGKISRKETIEEMEKEINKLVEEINWLENRPRSNPKNRR